MKDPIKIMIVDDHAILRVGLSSLLNTFDDLAVVGDAATGEQAVRLYPSLVPDVVILDLMMPEMDGIETTKRLKAADPDARILILTTFGTSDGISRALDAGACGAIMKNAEITELTKAIRSVAAGKRFVAREIERIIANDPPVPELTPRQFEILESLVRGLPSTDIARQLGISHDMVREHSTALFKKLGAANRTEAVAIALRKQLLKIRKQGSDLIDIVALI